MENEKYIEVYGIECECCGFPMYQEFEDERGNFLMFNDEKIAKKIAKEISESEGEYVKIHKYKVYK